MKQKQKTIMSLFLLLTLSMTMLIPVYAANMAETETQATALKQLGLFKGVSDTDFDLNRAPTRTEALVMLIRVLGKETEALSGSWSHPFNDVETWADKYIGYAYQNGLTKGVSATQLGTGTANSDMYLTFVLRALDYNDSKGDFAWDQPESLATSVGVLSDSINTDNFLRADIVTVSWAALDARLKDGSRTLSEKLINAGVFTSENYNTVKLALKEDGTNSAGKGEVTVSNFDDFKSAVENKETITVNISSDIAITSSLTFERDDSLAINIKKGATLTVSETFIPVGGIITNEGTIIINGTFDRGICNLNNNGSVIVKKGGTFSSGMSDTYNSGTVIVDDGGSLLIERGTQFNNTGSITNNGYISIKDGGNLDNKDGSIINNGTIDLYSYFDGDITKITGSGILNKNN